MSCSLASGEQITLHRRAQLHVCFVLLNGQYITAELEALVAPGINHSLLSCGSLVRKGWRVESFDNRMSVSHAGLGGCSLVELCTLFSRNIGWIYSRSLSVDVASANDDFSFAYVVGERQGGETVDCSSWTKQQGDGKPAVVYGANPYLRSMRDGPAGGGGRCRDPFLGEKESQSPGELSQSSVEDETPQLVGSFAPVIRGAKTQPGGCGFRP